MHSSAQAEHSYTFGKIKFEVSVDGNVDNADSVVNHLLATATSVEGIETIQHGLTDGQTNGDKHQQECIATVTFGEVTVSAKLSFDLKRHTSNRTLNTIVLGVILPKIWQTAGIYLGDGPTPASQAQMPQSELVSKIDAVLGIAPASLGSGYEQSLDQPGSNRRQLATR
jgi:hypothetical protein